MTVRDLVNVIDKRFCKTIEIAYNGGVVPLDEQDAVMMAAYGDFRVSSLSASTVGADGIATVYQLDLAVSPVREVSE